MCQLKPQYAQSTWRERSLLALAIWLWEGGTKGGSFLYLKGTGLGYRLPNPTFQLACLISQHVTNTFFPSRSIQNFNPYSAVSKVEVKAAVRFPAQAQQPSIILNSPKLRESI